MTTVLSSTIHINSPVAQVWEAVSDFGNIKRFHPVLKDSFPTSEKNGGLGATRHCDLAPMGSIVEKSRWASSIMLRRGTNESRRLQAYSGNCIIPLHSLSVCTPPEL